MNGQANPVIWKKGLLDGVPMFDLELARLSEDGLILVALNGAFSLIPLKQEKDSS